MAIKDPDMPRVEGKSLKNVSKTSEGKSYLYFSTRALQLHDVVDDELAVFADTTYPCNRGVLQGPRELVSTSPFRGVYQIQYYYPLLH